MKFFLRHFFQIAGVAILLAGCNLYTAQPKTSVSSTPASAFLLDASVFPTGWVSYSDDPGTIVAGRDFGIANVPGHSFQEVYRRPSNDDASKKYKVYLAGEFNVSGTHQPAVPFALPGEITFKSKIADEYYFACGVDVIPQCKMLARYQNYFVFLYFDVSTKKSLGGLTYPEIERVLESLEIKVSNVLNFSESQK